MLHLKRNEIYNTFKTRRDGLPRHFSSDVGRGGGRLVDEQMSSPWHARERGRRGGGGSLGRGLAVAQE